MDDAFPVANCANPECGAPFDAHQGKMYRFHKSSSPDDSEVDADGTLYYWLCAECAQEYMLESAGDHSATVLWLKCASGKGSRGRS